MTNVFSENARGIKQAESYRDIAFVSFTVAKGHTLNGTPATFLKVALYTDLDTVELLPTGAFLDGNPDDNQAYEKAYKLADTIGKTIKAPLVTPSEADLMKQALTKGDTTAIEILIKDTNWGSYRPYGTDNGHISTRVTPDGNTECYRVGHESEPVAWLSELVDAREVAEALTVIRRTFL